MGRACRLRGSKRHWPHSVTAGERPSRELRAGRPDRGMMCLGPVDELEDRREQGLAERRQGLLDRRWHSGEHRPPNETVAPQIPEGLRQHPLRDVRERPSQLAEAMRSCGRPCLWEARQHICNKICLISDSQIAHRIENWTSEVLQGCVARREHPLARQLL